MEETTESSVYLLLGNVDSGKTTLLGVLVSGELDDGNGYARSKIVKLKHEIESGKTSSHSPHYIITDNKVTTIIDLCGHEKYMKTTMFGVTGLFGNYGIVIIGANMGVNGTTKEHIQMLLAMKIPFMIIVTKIDLCQSDDMMNSLKKTISRVAAGCGRKTVEFFQDEQLEINDTHRSIMGQMESGNSSVIPTIMVSNKTGHNIGFVRQFITTMNNDVYKIRTGQIPKSPNNIPNAKPTMFLDSRFNVDGIGVVLSGTMKYGDLHMHDTVYIGPINDKYIKATIKTMKNRIGNDVDVIYQNESGTVGIRLHDKKSYSVDMFRKGQILCTDESFALEYTCYTLYTDIVAFNTGTNIRDGYQCVLHCGTIRHTVQFCGEITDFRPCTRQTIKMKFQGESEFVIPGTRLMFRDGLTRGFGIITDIVNFREDKRNHTRKSGKVTLKKL